VDRLKMHSIPDTRALSPEALAAKFAIVLN